VTHSIFTKALLESSVQQRKVRRIGHILRHDSLLQDIMEGSMLGKAAGG